MGSLSTLRSPGLIQVVDGGCDDEGFYQVVELLNGPLLSDTLTGSPMDLEDFEQFSKDLLATLEELHAHHLFHTGLSAQSIQLTKRTLGGQRYKLIDLGLTAIARSIRSERGARHYGLIEPALMPPEYFEGKTPSQQMDIFNCGQLFYAALVGGHPLAGLERDEIHRRVMEGDYPTIHEYRPELPIELSQWIEKMTAPDPADRFDSVREALKNRPNIPELAIRLIEATQRVFHHQQSKISSQPGPKIQNFVETTETASLKMVMTVITLIILISCLALVALRGGF